MSTTVSREWLFWRLSNFLSISPQPVANGRRSSPQSPTRWPKPGNFQGLAPAGRPAWTTGHLDPKLRARSPVLEGLWFQSLPGRTKEISVVTSTQPWAALFSYLAGFPCVLFHIKFLLPPPLRWLVEIKYPGITLKGGEKLIQNFNQNMSPTVPSLWNAKQTPGP